jgi:hypothetical protein
VFCTGDQNSAGRSCVFSCKDVRGDCSSHVKLTGEFGNAIEGIRISNAFRFLFSRKIRGAATFDFCNTLQHYLPKGDIKFGLEVAGAKTL